MERWALVSKVVERTRVKRREKRMSFIFVKKFNLLLRNFI